MRLRMFYIEKPRKFAYKPVYYNPDEEENTTISKDNKKKEPEKKYFKTLSRKISAKKGINMTYVLIVILLLMLIFLI